LCYAGATSFGDGADQPLDKSSEHAEAGYSVASCALIHPRERRAAAGLFGFGKENVTSFGFAKRGFCQERWDSTGVLQEKNRDEGRQFAVRFLGRVAAGGRTGRFCTKAARHPITFDDMIKLHRGAEPQVSPDANGWAYTVATPDMEANRNASNIWMVPTTGGSATQLTQSGHDSSPVWPRDGEDARVSLLARRRIASLFAFDGRR